MEQTALKLEKKVAQVKWGIGRSADSDHKVRFYTGIPSYQVLMALLAHLKRSSSALVDTTRRPRPHLAHPGHGSLRMNLAVLLM